MKGGRGALIALALALVAASLVVLLLGRHPAPPEEFLRAMLDWAAGRPLSPERQQLLFLIVQIRLPRVLAAILVGASLSTSGAVYQGMFLNHLVSPGILGVVAGASFGSALGIVIFNSWAATQALAFAGGALGVALSLLMARLYPRSPILALIIGGLLSGSLLSSGTSLLKFVADPENELPQLVYWMMGTLSKARLGDLETAAPPMLAALTALCLAGKTVDALCQGDDEARSLGIDTRRARLWLIGAATLACSMSVILSGIVSWVGLVMPHVTRLALGPGHRILLPASALVGALFLVGADTATRLVWTVEFPLGISTSLTCLPIFAAILWRDRLRRN